MRTSPKTRRVAPEAVSRETVRILLHLWDCRLEPSRDHDEYVEGLRVLRKFVAQSSSPYAAEDAAESEES